MRRSCSPEGRAVRGMARRSASARRAKLYAKIGQLTVERDFLAREARAVSAPDRRAMVERSLATATLSVRRQCALLSLTRSGVYRSKPVTKADDLAVMPPVSTNACISNFRSTAPRRMTSFELNKEGRLGSKKPAKRVRRLMRVMGIEALVPRPGTSQSRARAQDIPLPLLRGLKIRRARRTTSPRGRGLT